MRSRKRPIIGSVDVPIMAGLRIVASTFLAVVLAHAAPLMAQDAELPEAEAKAVEETGSPGLNIPFDGSSVEAFEKSLEKIRAETTAAEFTTLRNALDYLLVYDLGARRNPKVLYQRLDGKTATEVLQMVKWRQEGRRSDGR